MLIGMLDRVGKVLTGSIEGLSVFARMLAVFVAFLVPLQNMVFIMMLFLFCDTFSAIYLRYRLIKNKVCPEGNKTVKGRAKCANLLWRVIDRDKFDKTVEKFFAYPVIAIMCFVFDTQVLRVNPSETGVIGYFTITNFAFISITFMDFKSSLRNMGLATGHSLYKAIANILTNAVNQKIGKQ